MDFIESRIIKILKVRTDISDDNISSGARLQEDLGLDSLDTAELVVELEAEYDIRIPDEGADLLHTVGDIIRIVDHELNPK